MLMQDFQDQLIKMYADCELDTEKKRYVVLEFANQVERSYQLDLANYRKKQAEELLKKQSEDNASKETEN